MEWWLVLLLIFGGLAVLFVLAMPVAFAFLFMTLIGLYIFVGGEAGLKIVSLNVFESITTFTLLPIPLFVLMGEVMFNSGMAFRMMNAIDNWLGRLPGRLSLLAVGMGTALSVLSGASMASTAVLGTVLAMFVAIFLGFSYAGYLAMICYGFAFGALIWRKFSK